MPQVHNTIFPLLCTQKLAHCVLTVEVLCFATIPHSVDHGDFTSCRTDPTDAPDPNPMWSYRSWRELDGYPYWGFFASYSGGGYRAEFGRCAKKPDVGFTSRKCTRIQCPCSAFPVFFVCVRAERQRRRRRRSSR